MAKRKMTKRKSQKFSSAIQALRRMKANQRYNAIRHANDKFICEIISHVRKLRTKKLAPKQRKLLKRYATKLRFISNPKVTLQRKRETLTQKGGFLSAILPMIAPAVGNLLGNIFGSKR
jgi:hypothetical protein